MEDSILVLMAMQHISDTAIELLMICTRVTNTRVFDDYCHQQDDPHGQHHLRSLDGTTKDEVWRDGSITCDEGYPANL